MTKKISPIEEHKQADLILVREKLLGIIEGKDSKAKDITDASKLLARMHKALQPERVGQKPQSEPKGKQKELSKLEMEEVEKILNE
jgi:hypothetical protein